MRNGIYIHFFVLLLLLVSCGQKKQNAIVAPWGEVHPEGEEAASQPDSIFNDFDLEEIQHSGELIALTLTGPETYYDYRGRHLGTQYLLCLRFANKLGVSLRMEVCRDTTEMLTRLENGEADMICYPLSKEEPGWMVGADKDDLQQELKSWYKPQMLAEVKRQEDYFLSTRSVRRKVYAPMINQQGGVISHYDAQFRRHAPHIRWDWRLLAAQCYQESCFDPQARSWAGACGLMQIMPSTADHLGLPRSQIYNPDQNIAAAVKYIAELQQSFSDIPDHAERTKFVLAAYNGGGFHIRDAMALARKYGRNPQRWRDVEPFVLGLQQAQYYKDPVVKNGYMRGSETVDYVRRIHDRWNAYRGIKVSHSFSAGGPIGGPTGIPQKAKRERKKKYQLE